tara:strand:- start:639 stop:815 length:177 start_codon:yes stop_codon:yes gene_type:complete
MNYFKILTFAFIICFPAYTFTNSCKDKAEREFRDCLEASPEWQWNICKAIYFKALEDC